MEHKDRERVEIRTLEEEEEEEEEEIIPDSNRYS
jgi:hypothetical protein